MKVRRRVQHTRLYDRRGLAKLALSICSLSALLLYCGSNLALGRSALPDAFSPDQLLWEIELGSHQYTVPRVDRGYLFIGINDLTLDHPVIESSGGGVLMCRSPLTGELIWQLPIPRNMEGRIPPFHFNHWKCGVCSTPALDGDCLYIVGPRGDVLCVDRHGQANGNDGPFLQDARYMGVPDGSDYELTNTDGDIIWQFDMIEQCQVVPHDVCGSSPAVHGDYLYVCTSNGADHTHDRVANPLAPNLIVLNKATGRLVATDGAIVGERNFHGQWSSPVVADIHGRTLVLFGAGDGILYAFDPIESPAAGDAVQTLKVAWSYDCCPRDYRERDGVPIPYSRWNRKRTDGPSEVIATPVVHKGRVYISIGQSPVHGPGAGLLSCIDGASGQRVWDSRDVGRSLSQVAIHDGLLYISDYNGQLSCLDEDSGETIWQHDLGSGVWTSSPVVVDGRILISTEKQLLCVFKAGRTGEVVSRSRVNSMAITPVLWEDILLFPTQRRLFAVRIDSSNRKQETTDD
jgi:outer membrane protein assembly factor BamB